MVVKQSRKVSGQTLLTISITGYSAGYNHNSDRCVIGT
jgi:hypothetical protein